MTDAEKDREAVEWGVKMAEGDWRSESGDKMRRVLALAREALEMRERGPVGYQVQTLGDGPKWYPQSVGYDKADAERICRRWKLGGNVTARIVPLYAGTPEEVPND